MGGRKDNNLIFVSIKEKAFLHKKKGGDRKRYPVLAPVSKGGKGGSTPFRHFWGGGVLFPQRREERKGGKAAAASFRHEREGGRIIEVLFLLTGLDSNSFCDN